MQVILLDKVAKLGGVGDKVTIKAGYARNFLIPQGKAVRATQQNIKYFEQLRDEAVSKAARELENAKLRAQKIAYLGTIKILSKTTSTGKLFGSIGAREISECLQRSGVIVYKKEIILPKGVLRTTGTHTVYIKLHNELSVKIILNILAE
ncbi:50S ribosomal protein L9 [Candidatus Ishikawella capsulata]|uniref:Large ribosomal subunit protein bL9 n=1 Tax=Candidatus Ishikawaella capsulata Mpkobe TaxID=476281 RepID=C5WCH5_9ENTR|nr:50S ribosomal protein L9 [Candidatus Ishikawaella capsulata]BAH83031.1 50S ribosomal protein L9 [Candidatus Ishikawaella capsulata Mpkobe]